MADQPTKMTDTRLYPANFRRFAFFDAFVVQRKWRAPALFLILMALFSSVCFAMHHKEGAVFLGCVLLGVGLLLPAAYLLSFLLSVNKQCKGISPKKIVYSLRFYEDYFDVLKSKEKASYPWKKLFRAYRTKHGVYLYVQPRHAFIVSDETDLDAIWHEIRSHLRRDQIHERRGAAER